MMSGFPQIFNQVRSKGWRKEPDELLQYMFTLSVEWIPLIGKKKKNPQLSHSYVATSICFSQGLA